MIPLDDSNADGPAETPLIGTSPPIRQRHSGDCTPTTAESDNVVESASGNCGMGDALVLMAKFWQPGQVKTRLAAKIGFDAAAALHELFTRRLSRSLGQAGDWRQVRVSPDDHCREMAAAISPAWTIAGQGNGNLGERMWRGFCQCFAAGATRIVMIGADLPTLQRPQIEVAFEHLSSCDVVLGPAIDGGYYLIGLNGRDGIDRFLPLFETLPWGTSSVFSETVSIAERCRLAVKQLEECEDVDHWPDLLRLIQRLERSDASDDTSLAVQIRSTLDRLAFSI